MKKRRLPKSLRKFIRQEKASIKRRFSDLAEQKRQIKILYQSLLK